MGGLFPRHPLPRSKRGELFRPDEGGQMATTAEVIIRGMIS